MNPPPIFTPEQLLEHGRSLRALARGLLGDEAAAEDTVQDALVLALEKPPAEREHVGGWLNTVVRTLALKRMRTEKRRTRREEVAARPEQTASTVDSVTSAALCKQLVDAVLELNEPYRSAISMRYFDDLPPREIAVRLGVPRNTVRARLQRGLVQLREKLDGDSEGGRDAWAPALLAFAGTKPTMVAATAGLTGSTLGVLAMASLGKWVAAALVIVALGFGLYEVRTEADDPLVTRNEAARPEAHPPADLAGVQSVRGSAPREDVTPTHVVATEGLAAQGGPPWASADRYPIEVSGRVVDAWGRPLRGASVYFAVDAQRFNTDTCTDAGGRYSVKFDANRPEVDVHLFFRRGAGHASGIRTVRAGSARVLNVDLYEALRTRREYQRPLDNAPFFRNQNDEPSLFVSQCGLEIRGFEAVEEDEEISIEDHFELVEEVASELVTFKGRVLAEDGEAARGTLVGARLVVEGIVKGFGSWTLTNDGGEWELKNLDPGTYSLHAGGDDYGLASVTRTGVRGDVQVWEARLDRGDEVRGRLLGPDEEPLDYFVCAEQVGYDASWSDTTQADKEGRFAFPNAPRGTVRLLVFDAANGVSGIPLHVEGGHAADGTERTVSVPREALESGYVSVWLTDAEGEPVVVAEVRLYHSASGRGVFMEPSHVPEESGRYFAADLPAGSYRVEANSPYYGWLDFGEFAVQPGAQLELGTLAFPPPGHMVVTHEAFNSEATDNWLIYRKGAHVDSLAWEEVFGWFLEEFHDPQTALRVQLPAGEYVLATREPNEGKDREVGGAWFPFEIASGQDTPLELPFALLADVTLRCPAEGGSVRTCTVTSEASGAQVHTMGLVAPQTSYVVKLLPGRYQAALKNAKGALVETTFEVEAATPLVVTITE